MGEKCACLANDLQVERKNEVIGKVIRQRASRMLVVDAIGPKFEVIDCWLQKRKGRLRAWSQRTDMPSVNAWTRLTYVESDHESVAPVGVSVHRIFFPSFRGGCPEEHAYLNKLKGRWYERASCKRREPQKHAAALERTSDSITRSPTSPPPTTHLCAASRPLKNHR